MDSMLQQLDLVADLMVDGNIGVIQTMVGELVKKPEHEREHPLHPETLQLRN